MPVSRAKSLPGALVAALVLTTGLSCAALAQPVPLTPGGSASDAGGPPTSLKVIPSPAAQEAEPARVQAGNSRFQVEELKAPDPEAVGTLDDRQGGFAATQWKGSSAELVRYYLPKIPAASGSRTARSLARRLLLTAAAAPEGNRGQTPGLLEMRAERLYAMGEVEGLSGLMKSLPSSASSAGLTQLKIDSYLLAGDTKAACAESATLVANQDPRMQVFCMMVGGKVLEANMALDLLRERKDADHAFIAAAEAMGGTPPAKVDKLPNATALHMAAFKAAKMPLPADAAGSAQPALLRALIDSPALAPEIRIPAAERAETLGILDADALRKVYASVTFTPEQQQQGQSQGDRTPRSRALLLKAAQADQTPSVRAELVAKVLAAAAERGAYAQTARVYAPLLAEMKPGPDLTPFAAALARGLVAAGRPESATAWVALAKSDPAQARSVGDLWALTRLYRMGDLPAASPETYAGWMGGRDLPPEAAERRGVVGLELLQAVGEKVPAAQWLAIPRGSRSTAITGPSPVVKALLRSAAEGQKLGETVLMSLVALGDGGLDHADPDLLNRVVSSLRMVGLEHDARDLAVEAGLANGL